MNEESARQIKSYAKNQENMDVKWNTIIGAKTLCEEWNDLWKKGVTCKQNKICREKERYKEKSDMRKKGAICVEKESYEKRNNM